MNCMNCGTSVSKTAEYCPKCGFHVLSQRKAVYLSKLYYNQGLEKATVRDLSGAISCLKESLKFNKLNILARNLLGLVYFETGEVVAALCEWVISKNLQPGDNLATTYIDRLQANPAKLEVINRTVNKYNLALSYCRQGNEDMAAIQLKKLLNQNPKLIKGYHLLALLQIRNEEYNKARRTLKKALKIDKTNTTTLRFLREVDEQTGMTTDLSGKTRRVKEESSEENTSRKRLIKSGNDLVILPPAFRENSLFGIGVNLFLGALIGFAALWFLVVPAMTQRVYDSINEEMVGSGETLSSVTTRVSELESQLQQSQEEVTQAQTDTQTANTKLTSTENLLLAYQSMNAGDYTTAATYLQQVQQADLSESNQTLYQTISANVSSETGSSDQGQDTAGSDSDDQDSGYDSGNDYDSGNGYDSSDNGYDSDSGY